MARRASRTSSNLAFDNQRATESRRLPAKPLLDVAGFTIVELLIVVVVISILASISVMAYSGIQQRATFAASQSSLSSLNKAIKLYYAENGTYPVTSGLNIASCEGNWCGFDQATGDGFIPGLVPKYISETPQMDSSKSRNDTFLYISNGVDYKLVKYNGDAGITGIERDLAIQAGLATTDCSDNWVNAARWGYWSSEASRCW